MEIDWIASCQGMQQGGLAEDPALRDAASVGSVGRAEW